MAQRVNESYLGSRGVGAHQCEDFAGAAEDGHSEWTTSMETVADAKMMIGAMIGKTLDDSIERNLEV